MERKIKRGESPQVKEGGFLKGEEEYQKGLALLLPLLFREEGTEDQARVMEGIASLERFLSIEGEFEEVRAYEVLAFGYYFLGPSYEKTVLRYLDKVPRGELSKRGEYLKGVLLLRKGEAKKALSYFGSPPYQAAGPRTQYMRGLALKSLGMYDKAVPIFETLKEDTKDMAFRTLILDHLAWCYYARRDYEESFQEYEILGKKEPGESKYQYWMLKVLLAMEKKKKGLALARKVLRRFPGNQNILRILRKLEKLK